MANELTASIQELLIDFLRPLEEAARDPHALADWLAMLGQTEATSRDPALLAIVQHAPVVVGKLAAFDAQALQTLAGLASVLECGREVADIQRELRNFAEAPGRSRATEGLAQDIMSFLLASHLRRRHPTAFRIASLLTLIEARETAPLDASIVEQGVTLRYARVLDRFKFASVGSLIARPGDVLEQAYLPNDMSLGADAWLGARRLFPNLSLLADVLGLAWRTEYRSTAAPSPSTDADPPEALLGHVDDVVDDDEVQSSAPALPDSYFAAHHPTFRLKLAEAAAGGELAIEILASSRQHAGAIPGFIVTTAGNFNHTETRGQWKLALSASGQIPAFAVQPDGFRRVPGDHASTNGAAKLLVERVPEAGSSGPAFLFGSAAGTRVEIGNLQLAAELSYKVEQLSASLGLAATSGALVIAPGDGDGFLSSILPAEGLRAEFDLGLAWSNTRGLTLRGGAGLEATIPIDRSVAGIKLSTLYLSLQARDDRIMTEVSASLGASIGPVQVAVDRIGLAAALSFPEHGGNLGVADLDFHFKPPSGLGLAIDAASVVGGGYLFFDHHKGEYSGILQLEVADKINVKAFGLLSTRLPDGAKGYSLIVFITAEDFQPIQLGLGFKLQGIGGMLAINRTFNEVAMRDGLKNNTLGTLLFPRDPIRNAPEILRNLATVFPAKLGSYLFGPMAKIGWATPTLIQMDLALILEFGARRRLIVLGRISAILPTRDKDLIRLNMDAMGILDFDVGTVSLDAVLVDSRLLQKFVLTGSMAMRACLVPGPRAGLALAVGGMNPHFAPPEGMPKLDRITINLTSGDNPRFTCEAYFAVTSNTIQFGSRAQMYAGAYGFSVQGDVGFDVLIQLLPFHFLAEFHASIQLKRGSRNLFKVKVAGALEGPRPLRVSAKATFEILWCDFSIRFDKTLIDGDAPPLPPAVNALLELKRALSAADSWNTQLPAGRQHGVVTRKLPGNAALSLDPLGDLRVKQSVLPLNTNRDLDTFGGAPLSGAKRFTITAATLNTAAQSIQLAKDSFAPAQFFDLSDDEKLASPSFEEMVSGLVFGSDAISIEESAAQRVSARLEYETILIDAAGAASPAQAGYVLRAEQVFQQARFASVAKAATRSTGLARFRNATVSPAVSMKAPRWLIASTTDLKTLAPSSVGASFGDARVALQTLRHTAGAAKWQLIPEYEVAP